MLQAASGPAAHARTRDLESAQFSRPDEHHVGVPLRLAREPVGEAGPAEAEQAGAGRTWPTLGCEQAADVTQPVQVRHAHDLVPLGLADGDDGLGFLILQAEYDDVELVVRPFAHIVDGCGLDPDRDSADRFFGGEVACPVPADLLEMRAEHVAGETALAALPQAAGVPGVLEIGPDGPHHGVVEGDQRLRDPECRAVLLERVWLAEDKAAVLQDVQRMREFARFAPYVRAD